MIEAYKIGVSLTLTGDAQKKLSQFTLTSKRAAEAVEQLNKMMRPLNDQFLKLSASLQKINPRLGRLGYALGDSNKNLQGLNRSFTGFNDKIGSAVDKTEALIVKTDQLKRSLAGVGEAAAASSEGIGAMSGAGGIGGGGRRGGGRGGRPGIHGRMRIHGEPFRMGVFGFSPGSVAAIGAGYGAYESYKINSEYQQLLSQVQLQNIPGATAANVSTYIDRQNIPGVSKLQLLQKFQDALTVSKNTAESEGIAPFLAQIGYANNAIYKGTSQELRDNDYYAMVKSAELITGSMDTNVLKPVINEMVKINSATSGQVKPTDWLQLMRRSRGVLRGADPSVMYQLEPLVQEYGGNAVGTMTRAFYQHLQSGRLTTAAALQLQKMHLVKPGHAKYNKIGMIQRILPGGIVDQNLLNKDFVDWYTKHFISYFKANHLTAQQEKTINGIIFTNSDLAEANSFVQQQDKIAKTAALNAKAAGTNQLIQQANALPTGSQAQLTAATTNLALAFGKLLSPATVIGMNALTWSINTFVIGIQSLAQLAAIGMNAGPHGPDKIASAAWTRGGLFGGHPAAIPPHVTAPTPIQTSVYLDGKVIAQSVNAHQGFEAVRWPQTGVNFPDPNMTLMTAGYNGR